MSLAGSVTRLIRQVKAGDAAAMQQLLTRYFRRLLGLARRKLHGKRTPTADEEDVAASVLAAFFIGVVRGQYTQLHDREDLWHLLVKITRNQIGHIRKYDNADIRTPPDGSPPRPLEVARDAVDPRDWHEEGSKVQERLDRLGDPALRSIAVWRWEGYSIKEIAAMLGCTVRTVERKLQLIRTIWSEGDVS
jgi:RNA polymerase sigma factor (sigma-70 family)